MKSVNNILPQHFLAWRIPGMGKSGGLPSMGSHRVGHDWSDLAAVAATFSIQIFSHVIRLGTLDSQWEYAELFCRGK